MGFWGILGVGAKTFVGNHVECNDRRSTSFDEKNCGDALNTLVCTRGKEITNKFVGPNVIFFQILNPEKYRERSSNAENISVLRITRFQTSLVQI